MKLLLKLFISSLLITTTYLSSQAQSDANVWMERLKEQNQKVRSFTADVEIDVDVSFIQIPIKKGKVYYQAPDKFRFRSSGFTLLPKKGFNFTVNEILWSESMALYAGDDSIGSKIKIVPLSDSADFILATAWIDTTIPRLKQLDISSTNQGNILMQFEYGDGKYELPIETKLSFEVKQLDIPMKFMGNASIDRSKFQGDKTTGTVRIKYDQLEVNIPIDPNIFREKEAEENEGEEK